MTRTLTILALALCAAAACSPTDIGNDEPTVSHGTSFNMCVGYCMSVLEIEGDVARLTETSQDRRQYPTRIRLVQIPAAEAARVRQLADPESLASVAGVHGCPDCADGGAEWIQLEIRDFRIRTTYDYRRDLESIEELQTLLRAIRQRFAG